jgi:hypothetical protein
MSSPSISLRVFGYNMASCDAARYGALHKAIAEHGVAKVVERLDEVKINIFHFAQTKRDIAYVMTLPESSVSDEEPEPRAQESIVRSTKQTVPIPEMTVDNARFVECMKLINEKLCKATIEKDVVTINLMVESMANVIRSTL